MKPYCITAVWSVGFFVTSVVAQPVTTRPADIAAQAMAPSLPSDKVYLAYRQAIDRDIGTYRDSVTEFRDRRADAALKAEATFQRAIETANAAYKAGTSRAYDMLDAARKSRNSAAIQAYDREVKAMTTAGDLERAAELAQARERFIARALEEGAKLQAEALAVAALVKPPAQGVADIDPERVTLHIRATIDGSDELIIKQDAATWMNKSWGMSSTATINGVEWRPSSSPVLPNAGPTKFLPAVDFSKAVVTSRSGREIVACEPSSDNLRIVFADASNGSGTYEIIIELPRKE